MAEQALTIGSLTIAGPDSTGDNGGVLDLRNGDLIIHQTVSQIGSLLCAGYNNGDWNGLGSVPGDYPAAIISDAAANDATAMTTLGYAYVGTNSYLEQLPITTLDGVSVSTGDTVVRTTIYGDTNLDGVINSDDLYFVLDSYIGQEVFGYNGSGGDSPDSSSSHGRKIHQVANPGPVATPTKIYVINDPSFAGVGHTAIIIPNGNGCTYYSYAVDGQVTTQDFNNIQDAMTASAAAGYARYECWGVSAEDAAAATTAAQAYNNSSYDVLNHNCWDMAYSALQAGNVTCVHQSAVPNDAFNTNAAGADTDGKISQFNSSGQAQ